MEIIDFNKTAANVNKEYETSNEKVDITESNDEHISVDKFSFTCPECKSVHYVDMKGIIFKTIEFFCKNCGKKFKAKNNGFRKRQQ